METNHDMFRRGVCYCEPLKGIQKGFRSRPSPVDLALQVLADRRASELATKKSDILEAFEIKVLFCTHWKEN